MKNKLILILGLASTLTVSLAAEAPPRPPINPALLYWQAASAMPSYTEDQARTLRALADGTRRFDAQTAKSLPPGDQTLRLLRKATESTAPCDWGLPIEDGPELALPHLSKLRQMASMSLVRAEEKFAEGKVKEGMDWVLATHRMARDAGVGELLISNLVQFAIEGSALKAAARHCLGWDEPSRRDYAAALQKLPPLHTTQKAYRGERLFVEWLERRIDDEKARGEIEQMLKTAISEDNAKDKEALAAQLAPAAMHAAVQEWSGLQGRTEAALGKPWPEASAELKALSEEVAHSKHYLIRASYPAIVKVSEKQFVIGTLHIMLEAALEQGAQLDAAAAAKFRDDFRGEPLGLKKNEDGTLILTTTGTPPPSGVVTLPLGK